MGSLLLAEVTHNIHAEMTLKIESIVPLNISLNISELTCGLPKEVDLTHVDFEDMFPGSRANYSCLEDYRPGSGNNVSVCMMDETWSPISLICECMYIVSSCMLCLIHLFLQ